jgi:uncharacterized protein YneF (UPF0154 family)
MTDGQFVGLLCSASFVLGMIWGFFLSKAQNK